MGLRKSGIIVLESNYLLITTFSTSIQPLTGSDTCNKYTPSGQAAVEVSHRPSGVLVKVADMVRP